MQKMFVLFAARSISAIIQWKKLTGYDDTCGSAKQKLLNQAIKLILKLSKFTGTFILLVEENKISFS